MSTWSRRKREAEKAASGIADVYQYDAPSARLREQVRQLLGSTIDKIQRVSYNSIYEGAVTLMRKELGRAVLVRGFFPDFESEYQSLILNEEDVDNWLTAIEISSRLISYYAKINGHPDWADDYVVELNAWMLEDSFGYQIEDGSVIQISNQFTYSKMVVPALMLLSENRFAGANSEFRQAHAEFRAGEYEDCIHDCCNAMESVLKVILDEKGWIYQSTDTAKRLLDVAFANNLIPSHMQNAFTGLRTILESGVPTVRNKIAGHGTGAIPRSIPGYIASFQLHQTAAAILLLVDAAR